MLTKVHLVKATVFPVVMYGCENWTIKKAEGQRMYAFELCCWSRLLRVPWTARSTQSILFSSVQFSSVHFSCSVLSDSLRPHESQHARPPCPSPTPGVQSDSHLSSQWCHPAISSSVVSFSSCPQSLPASVFSNESTLRLDFTISRKVSLIFFYFIPHWR